MSNTKVQNANSNNNPLFKLQDNANTFVSNAFPLRRFVRSTLDHEQAWIAAYKTESKKYFEAVLTNQKLDDIEREQNDREKNSIPKRRILDQKNLFQENKTARNLNFLDGFYLMQLCCVEDPLDLCSVDISAKNLKNIKEEDMHLFENITDINANENNLNFEAFRNFQNLKHLLLACNNIKTIRLKHEEFTTLESLDLSYNNLNPNDISHLGVLKNLKMLKLTGNNLTYLPDTFTKLYVVSKDNKKIVSEKFSNLEELYLDHNKLREENSFDVLAVLSKLRILYLNSNCLTCVPNLKIFRDNHVVQEFNKSYHKRKSKRKAESVKSSTNSRKSSVDKLNVESMVKDLTIERSNSELNMHNSNILRNSFIIEEDEGEEEENPGKQKNDKDTLESQKPILTRRSSARNETIMEEISNNNNQQENVDMMEKSFDLPFTELIYINLADNQIEEEDDLISLVSWPMLNEIIIYGNPIVYNNVGHPPLLKQYLIDRLGINLQRSRPLKALKTPLLLPQREHRLVDTSVPKIPKMPVEMRMLTYNLESEDLLSSNSITSVTSNDEMKKGSSPNENKPRNEVFKPFKHEKSNDYDEIDEYYENLQLNQEKDKNYNSFFMTQVDQDEAAALNNQENQNNKNKKKSKKLKEMEENVKESSMSSLSSVSTSSSSSSQSHSNTTTTTTTTPTPTTTTTTTTISTLKNSKSTDRFRNYELLLHIENEHEIKVPKDVNSSVRVLKQMLNNPLVFREPCRELDKKQTAFKTINKDNTPKQVTKSKHLQPRLAQVNEIIDELKDKQHAVETSLNEALSSNDSQIHTDSKRLFDQAQSKYNRIKKDSLRTLHGPRKTKSQMDIILEQIKTDNESELVTDY